MTTLRAYGLLPATESYERGFAGTGSRVFRSAWEAARYAVANRLPHDVYEIDLEDEWSAAVSADDRLLAPCVVLRRCEPLVEGV